MMNKILEVNKIKLIKKNLKGHDFENGSRLTYARFEYENGQRQMLELVVNQQDLVVDYRVLIN